MEWSGVKYLVVTHRIQWYIPVSATSTARMPPKDRDKRSTSVDTSTARLWGGVREGGSERRGTNKRVREGVTGSMLQGMCSGKASIVVMT